MMLRGGGRLYLEFMVSRGKGDPFARRQHVHAVPVPLVVRELEARGATVLARRVVQPEQMSEVAEGHRIGRVVVEWRR